MKTEIQQKLNELVTNVYTTLETNYGIKLPQDRIEINFVEDFQEKQLNEKYRSLEDQRTNVTFEKGKNGEKESFEVKRSKEKYLNQLIDEQEYIAQKGLLKVFYQKKNPTYFVELPLVNSLEELAEKEEELVDTLAHELGGHVFLYENNKKLRKKRKCAGELNATEKEMLAINEELTPLIDYIQEWNENAVRNVPGDFKPFSEEEILNKNEKDDLFFDLKLTAYRKNTYNLRKCNLINQLEGRKSPIKFSRLDDVLEDDENDPVIKKMNEQLKEDYQKDEEQRQRCEESYDPNLGKVCDAASSIFYKLERLRIKQLDAYEALKKLPQTKLLEEGWSTYIGTIVSATYKGEDSQERINEKLENGSSEILSLSPYQGGLRFFSLYSDFKKAKKAALKLKDSQEVVKESKKLLGLKT